MYHAVDSSPLSAVGEFERHAMEINMIKVTLADVNN